MQLLCLCFHVTQKAMKSPLYFFFFSFLLLFLDRLVFIVFYLCFCRLLVNICVTSIRLLSLDRLKKNSAANIPVVVICDVCGPWHLMCFSLFMITSIDSIQKRTKAVNMETRWKVTEDSRLKKQRNQVDK